LRWWSSRLGRDEEIRLVPLVSRPAATLDGGTLSARPSTVVVEVGGARLHVVRGFDPALLADVVRALSRGSET